MESSTLINGTAPEAADSGGNMRGDLRLGAVIVIVMTVTGALLGFIWMLWSPPRPIGLMIAPRAIEVDETEAFIASDGRFAIIALLVGVIAGYIVWCQRRNRGPVAVIALLIGGIGGAVAMDFVGWFSGGGTNSGAVNTLISQLPLQVHLTSLLLVEALAAVFVYGILVAFASDTDLGRSPRRMPVGPSVNFYDAEPT